MSHPNSHCERSPSLVFRLLPALLAGALTLPVLSGCAYQPGGDEIAFLRDGALVALNPDGSDARTLASGGIVSFAWSPDHHQLVYRTAPGSDVADLLPTATLAAPDATGSLEVTSINGGRAVQITPDDKGIALSDAWWDANGNRLVYREELAGTDPDASAAAFVISQADQPAGIARKPLYNAAAIPAIAADGSQVATVDASGALLVAHPGQQGQALVTGALVTLPGTGRPARVLWQPAHAALLYETASGGDTALVLRSLSGGQRTVATLPALLDAAFSPDGSHLLVRAPDAFQYWPVSVPASAPTYSIAESDPSALAWWSPDGRWLLVQDAAGWRLVNATTGAAQTLVQYGAGQPGPAIPAQAQWHPAAAGPWSPDGTRFVFVAASGTTWRGKPLPQAGRGGAGLYVAGIANGHPAAHPDRIDSGSDRVPDWSYLDPSTTFLVPS